MTVRHGGATQTPFKALFLCKRGIRETQQRYSHERVLLRFWCEHGKRGCGPVAFIRQNTQTSTHTHTLTLLAKRERGVERGVERLQDNQHSLSSVNPYNKDLTSVCQCSHPHNSAWHRRGKGPPQNIHTD